MCTLSLLVVLLSLSPLAQGVRVSTPLPVVPPDVAGASVEDFQLLPGGSEVLYRARHTSSSVENLRVAITGGVSRPSQLEGTGLDGQFTPDGGRALYWLSTFTVEFDWLSSLYVQATDESGPASDLWDTGTYPPPRVLIAPDGSQIVFGDVGRLFAEPLDQYAPLLLSTNGQVVQSDYAISPDGAFAVYRTSTGALYGVRTDGLHAPVQLNGALVAGGAVTDFAISPDSTMVAYRADQTVDERFELFARALDGSGSATLVSGTLVACGDVQPGYAITADSLGVVYRADALIDERLELFRALLDASSAPVRLSRVTVAGGNVQPDFALDSPGQRVVFRADAVVDERFELFSAPLDGSALPVRIGEIPLPGGDVTSFALSPAGTWVVYRGDPDQDERFELFSAKIDGSTLPIALAGTIPDTADVQAEYRISPDGARVAFRVDRNADETFELSTRAVDGSTPLFQVNGTLVAGGDVEPDFAWTPDGAHLVYRADARYDGVDELFASDLAAVPVRLNGELGPVLGDVSTFALTKGAQRAVYLADRDVDGISALYSDAVDGPPHLVELNPPLSAGERASTFQLTPEGRRAVFFTYNGATFELYQAPTDGSAAPVHLNPSPLGYAWFALTPDGERVLYLYNYIHDLYSTAVDGSMVPAQLNAPLGNDTLSLPVVAEHGGRAVFGVNEFFQHNFTRSLWSVPVDGSHAALLLTPRFVRDGRAYSYRISADGSRCVYDADQDTVNVIELYSVPMDASAAPVVLNAPVVPGGDVLEFALSADSSRAVYRADQDTDEVVELYSVPLDASAPPVKLSAALVSGGDVQSFALAPDSSRVAYLADQDTDGVVELYSTLIGSGAVVKLNGPAVVPGVLDFAIAPDSIRVVFRQAGALYSAPLDGSAPPIRIADALASIPFPYQVSPDGHWVAWIAPSREVFVAASDGTGAPRAISGPMLPGGAGAQQLAFSSDSRRVVYLADQATRGAMELFMGFVGHAAWHWKE